MSVESLPPMGHNNPPEVTEQVAQEQTEKYQDKLAELQRLMAKVPSLPKEIKDDESAGEVSDWSKLVKNLIAEIDKLRMAEKKKYTVWSDAIQNFWKSRTEKLTDVMKGVREPLDAYLQEKKDREERERAEAARIKQEKADALLREAQEKERIANERLAQERAERERVEREQEAARKRREEEIKEIQRKAEEEAAKLRKEAEEREAAARKREQDLKDQLEAEKEKARMAEKFDQDRADAEEEDRQFEIKKQLAIAELERKQASKELRSVNREAESIFKEAKAEIKEIKSEGYDEDQDLEAGLKELKNEANEAAREVRAAIDTAVRADKDYRKAEKQTLAGAAELSRTRGTGSLSSLREKLVAEMSDRDLLLKSAPVIWDHFKADDINAALQRWAEVEYSKTDSLPRLEGAIITIESLAVTR